MFTFAISSPFERRGIGWSRTLRLVGKKSAEPISALFLCAPVAAGGVSLLCGRRYRGAVHKGTLLSATSPSCSIKARSSPRGDPPAALSFADRRDLCSLDQALYPLPREASPARPGQRG